MMHNQSAHSRVSCEKAIVDAPAMNQAVSVEASVLRSRKRRKLQRKLTSTTVGRTIHSTGEPSQPPNTCAHHRHVRHARQHHGEKLCDGSGTSHQQQRAFPVSPARSCWFLTYLCQKLRPVVGGAEDGGAVCIGQVRVRGAEIELRGDPARDLILRRSRWVSGT